MKKVLLLGLSILVLATSLIALSDFKGKNSTVISPSQKNTELFQLREEIKRLKADELNGLTGPRVTINGFSTEANLRAIVFFEDDFEGGMDQWIPMSSYDFAFTPTGQDNSEWYIEDVIVAGGDASWGANDAGDHSRDFLVGPVITVPDSVTEFGVTTALKITNVRAMVNADATGFFAMRVGLDDDRWEQTASGPLVGTSSWLVDASFESNNSRFWANTPDIDLTGETGSVTLTFKHEGISEDVGQEWDLATVDVSDDGWETYLVLERFFGVWGPMVTTTDLTAWAGSTIQLRFRYSGDEAFIKTGSFWMFDSVEVNGAALIYSNDGGDAGAGDDLVTGGIAEASFISPNFNAARGGWESINFGNILSHPAVSSGVDIRLAVNWAHDPSDGVVDAGFFIDDVSIDGIGDVPTDLALIQLRNSQTVALNEMTDFSWVIENVGLDPLNGTVQVKAVITDDNDAVVGNPQNIVSVSNFLPGESMTIPAIGLTNWLADETGEYEVEATANISGDQFTDNNARTYVLHVFDPPLSGAVYKEDFEVGLNYGDVGFDLDDGGGDTTNTVTWAYDNWPFGPGATIGGYAQGDVQGIPINYAEHANETLISPPINISSVGPNNRLMLEFFFYWRIGHPAIPTITMAGTDSSFTEFSVMGSTDGGENWDYIFDVSHQDTIWYDCFPDPEDPGDLCERFFEFVTFDISEFIGEGDYLWLKFNYTSDNQYSFLIVFDDILVYQAIGKSYITSVDDIPGDQGRQVRVNWLQSGNDSRVFDEFGIPFAATEYSLWRWISGGTVVESDRPVTTVKDWDELVAITKYAEPEQRYHVSSTTDEFDFIALVPVTEADNYHYVSPTLYDIDESVFGVLTHTENDFVYSRSNLNGGASTDDLAPEPPAELVGSVSNDEVVLAWMLGDPRDDTFKENNVYRGTTSNTATMTLLATTSANDYVDATAEIGVDYFYAVTSVDFAGNESNFSNVEAIMIVGIGDETSLPTEFALRQNYPNPFNPSTTISYSLPTASDVKIVVYNLLGNEIATLVNGQQAAGYHNVEWNGRSNSGQLVSTGVYLYRISADDFTSIRKMILMK